MRPENGAYGLIIGGIFAFVVALFLVSGGELGGKKTVEHDADLPPVAEGAAQNR